MNLSKLEILCKTINNTLKEGEKCTIIKDDSNLWYNNIKCKIIEAYMDTKLHIVYVRKNSRKIQELIVYDTSILIIYKKYIDIDINQFTGYYINDIHIQDRDTFDKTLFDDIIKKYENYIIKYNL